MVSLDFPEAGFGTIGLTLSVAGQPVIREMDFHVVPGEVHALVGKQKEGKTTFCNILAGLIRPSSGWILAGGRPYRHLTREQSRSLGIEYVGDQPRVFPELSVAENIHTGGGWREAFGLWRPGFSAIARWLDGFSVRLPYGAPLKRLRHEDWLFVQLLGRLACRPRLLLLDETLEQLSARRFREAMAVVRDLLGRGMGVVWVTHNLEDALQTADRVTVLREGRPLATDLTRNFDRLSLLRLSYSELGDKAGADVTREQFYELMRFVEAMLRDMPAAVLICDLEWRVRFVNQSGRKLFPQYANPAGLSLSELLGDQNQRLAELAEGALSPEGDGEWHSLAVRLGGGDRLVDVRARDIQERNERIGRMLVIEDVTVRESMRQELALSENLASIGLLAAGVAHEVNDPLAIISNYLGFIRGESPDPEVTEAANLAQEETVRIQQIVDNLVTFSGNRPPGSDSVDLMALLQELIALLRFHANDRDVKLSCHGPGEPLFVKADANEMRQVFLNLFRNSLDAIEGRGEVGAEGAVETGPDGERRVRVRVFDNGKGIQFENTDDVFRPFITTKRGKNPHQGLGLSIVYGIVERYGGRISAQNRPGGGCEFSLSFPVAEPVGEV